MKCTSLIEFNCNDNHVLYCPNNILKIVRRQTTREDNSALVTEGGTFIIYNLNNVKCIEARTNDMRDETHLVIDGKDLNFVLKFSEAQKLLQSLE